MNRFWAALSMPRARRTRIRTALALTAFATGIAAGAGLYIGVDGLYVKLTTPPPAPPGAAAMVAIGNDVALSASVRPAVQNAIAGVQACSESPASGEAVLQQAITTRQDILHGLKTLSVADLPNGAQLVSALTTAMQQSLDADKDYKAWMADLASSRTCVSDPNQDSHFVAAGTTSASATTSKNAFLAIWNAMAPRYGQPTYSVTGF
jgi:hypothetical protein